ncbi:F0F1 ATP synthase subunit B [candidate division KSB1 bacterium]|nr:F0F1 ATP synthase subunit B [candidate division KSB1 bacterium]
MELMTPHGGTIFWTTVTFVALLLIMWKVAWKPIIQALNERETKIRESLSAADKAKQDVEQALANQQDLIAESKKEAQQIIEKSRNSAELLKDEILQKANAEAENMLVNAKKEIELSRDKAMEDIRNLAVDLSMAATQKLIGKALDKSEHHALIQNSMKKMEDLN